MDAERKSYYETLDIPTNASPQEIESAYVRARNAYSGDSVALYSLMTKDECDAILGQIEEAYSVIGFPDKRREYDRLRGFNTSGLNSSAQTSSEASAGMNNAFESRPKDTIQYEDFGSNKMEAKVSKITALKKFGLDYQEDEDFDKEIAACTDFTGSFLKKIREYKNVSVERMAEMTRVSKTHINAIENEDLGRLPADVYVRGYVYQYAKVLKLNPDAVAASFLLNFKKLRNKN